MSPSSPQVLEWGLTALCSPWVLEWGLTALCSTCLANVWLTPEICKRHSTAKDQNSALAGKLHYTRQQELNWLTMTNPWFCGLPGCNDLSIVHLTVEINENTISQSQINSFLCCLSLYSSSYIGRKLSPTHLFWEGGILCTYLCVHVPSKHFH